MQDDKNDLEPPADTQEVSCEPPSDRAAEIRPMARRIVVRPKKVVGRRPADKKRKAMMALIPLLAITLAVLLKRPVGTPRSAAAQEAGPQPAAAFAGADIEIDWQIPPVYDPTLRDPMQLTSPREKVSSEPAPIEDITPHVELKVTGILYSREEPTAIVNTQVVHEGDLVSGATVASIDPDAVEFEMSGRRWRQSVDTPELRR